MGRMNHKEGRLEKGEVEEWNTDAPDVNDIPPLRQHQSIILEMG